MQTMISILLLCMIVIICSACSSNIEKDIKNELNQKGERVVKIKRLEKIKQYDDCYQFEAEYLPGEKTGHYVGGVPIQGFIAKIVDGKIVNFVFDYTGLDATARMVCRDNTPLSVISEQPKIETVQKETNIEEAKPVTVYIDTLPYSVIDLPTRNIKPDHKIGKLIKTRFGVSKVSTMGPVETNGTVSEIVVATETVPMDSIWVESIDLNQDGQDEVVLQGNDSELCQGGSLNCPIEIYKLSSGTYMHILSERGKKYQITADKTNGFNDIVISTNINEHENRLTLHKYNGKEYSKKSVVFWEITEGYSKVKGYMTDEMHQKTQ